MKKKKEKERGAESWVRAEACSGWFWAPGTAQLGWWLSLLIFFCVVSFLIFCFLICFMYFAKMFQFNSNKFLVLSNIHCSVLNH
jgi:hypothetical protein